MRYFKKLIKLILFLEILDLIYNYLQIKAKFIEFERMPCINGRLKIITKVIVVLVIILLLIVVQIKILLAVIQGVILS